MLRENLNQDLSDATHILLKTARELSFNPISDHCRYILTIEKDSTLSFSEQDKQRKSENDTKAPRSLEDIQPELEDLYPMLHEIDLHIYRAYKNLTIIELRCIRRSAHNIDPNIPLNEQSVLIHCKVGIPPYVFGTKNKFGMNWKHGTIHHTLRMLWWRLSQKTGL